MALKKGDAALSESMINIVAVIISFVLILLVVKGLFFQSSDRAYSSAFEPLTLQLASSIDRTIALSGSQLTQIDIQEGILVNITIDQKVVSVSHDKGSVERSFSGLLRSGPYFFENPRSLCLVKNRDDRRVIISGGKCACNPGDGTCDPECLLNYICDSDCLTEEVDFVCSKYCSKTGDGLCDPDCYTGDEDMICDFDCILPGETDGICDPDCDDIEKGVCDVDCTIIYNGTAGGGGICDPDCKPTDSDGDGYEDEADGYCYTGCAERKGGVLRLEKDGICDIDCNATNEICDPDCNLDEDCEEKCAKVGENCTEIPCCQMDGPEVCCPGTMLCADASNPNEPACCGNGKCEVSPVVGKLREEVEQSSWRYGGGTGNYKDFRQPVWDVYVSPAHWENFYTCPDDCSSPSASGGDLVCSRKTGSGGRDADCPAYCKPGTGVYKYDCCLPDQSAHGSYWGISYSSCPYVDLQQDASDGICTQVVGDGCDPDCRNVPQLCDPDCCAFNSNSDCPSSPGCYCPVRVNMSQNFDKSPAFFDTNPTNPDGDKVYWTSGAIEVCSDAAIKYLDRRGWDIKQFEEDLTSPDPLGFAFDGSRYSTIRNSGGLCTPAEQGSFVQKASKTIEANEEYNLESNYCCSYYCGRCGNAEYSGPLCDGVGFCGDHSVAILSILRTLGVPAYDVYAGFSSSANPQFRHAYVIYFCDPDLPDHLTLSACEGNINKWLRVDATHHKIEVFEGTQWCDHFCIAYNDYGAFPQIDARAYGFGGAYNQTDGYIFPKSGMGGWAALGSYNAARTLNCRTDASCHVNRESPKGLCQFIGIKTCLT
ncbi:MAG: hypothetical protein ACP5E4_03780 [Candidatus Aenigmatarchaeota archaeon]